jgi:hypothetical protein
MSKEWTRDGVVDALFIGNNRWHSAHTEAKAQLNGSASIVRVNGMSAIEVAPLAGDVSVPMTDQTQFDVEFWYGTRMSGGSGGYQYLWGNHDGTVGHCFAAAHTGIGARWGWYPGDGPSLVDSGETMLTNVPYLFVMTRDIMDNSITIWRNGQAMATYSAGGVRVNRDRFTIGSAGPNLPSLAAGSRVFMAGRISRMRRGWRKEDVQAFSANPWQVLEGERRITFQPAAAPSGVTGTLAASESGADTAALTGRVLVKGSASASETGADSAAATGRVLVKGALAASEEGADTAVITGSSGLPVIDGFMSVNESAIGDSAAVTGRVLVKGTMSAVESGQDSAAVVGTGPLPSRIGVLSAVETTQDGFLAAGRVLVQGELSAWEDGQDSAAFVQTQYTRAPLGDAGWGARGQRAGPQRPANTGPNRPER